MLLFFFCCCCFAREEATTEYSRIGRSAQIYIVINIQQIVRIYKDFIILKKMGENADVEE